MMLNRLMGTTLQRSLLRMTLPICAECYLDSRKEWKAECSNGESEDCPWDFRPQLASMDGRLQRYGPSEQVAQLEAKDSFKSYLLVGALLHHLRHLLRGHLYDSSCFRLACSRPRGYDAKQEAILQDVDWNWLIIGGWHMDTRGDYRSRDQGDPPFHANPRPSYRDHDLRPACLHLPCSPHSPSRSSESPNSDASAPCSMRPRPHLGLTTGTNRSCGLTDGL